MSSLSSFISDSTPRTFTRALGAGKTWGHIVLGWVEHGANPSKGWEKQGRFALNYLVQGTGAFVDSHGKQRTLEPGYLYHHFPETKARVALDPTANCIEFYLTIDSGTYDGLRLLHLIPDQEVLTTHNNQLAIEAIIRFCEVCAKPARETNRRQIIDGLVDFLTTLYDLTIDGPALSHWHEVVHAATQQLEANLEKKLYLPAVAKAYGVSYASFRREFKRIVGVSPAEYRIRQRIEASCGLLARYTVKEVAEQLGYCDPFTFSSQFKAFTGFSPSEFRQGPQG